MLHLLHKACSLFNNKKQFDKNKTIEGKNEPSCASILERS